MVIGKERVAIGVDSDGNEVVLFGDKADYPMLDGSKSTGLVAAVPLDYITDFLFQDKENQMIYFIIIRNDGSIVINNSHLELEDSSKKLPEQISMYGEDSKSEYSAEVFLDALKNQQVYTSNIEIYGEEQMLSSIPLANSEWNLISIMLIIITLGNHRSHA